MYMLSKVFDLHFDVFLKKNFIYEKFDFTNNLKYMYVYSNNTKSWLVRDFEHKPFHDQMWLRKLKFDKYIKRY